MRSALKVWPVAEILAAGKAMLITLRRGLQQHPPSHPSSAFRGLPALRLDHEGRHTCTACGRCAAVCPTQCLQVSSRESDITFELEWQRCMCCGVCAATCPVQAIECSPETNLWIDPERQGGRSDP